MCGVAGSLAPRGTADVVQVHEMLDLLAHRGPDGRGLIEAGPVCFGHVRLSILDLSDWAAQPMRSCSGRSLLTYNGEVYNFPDLRKRLHDIGIEPRSSGDTEVLLEHLEAFGVDETVRAIEGFFAFGLWDAQRSTLTLARDRYGKKPLYWSSSDGAVRFASEAKALVRSRTRPDLTTLNAMLLGFSASWGRQTPFTDIEALEPGSIIEFHDTTLPQHRRWFSLEELVDADLHTELDRCDDREVIERVAAALDDSLRYRMVSDVPVASLVSGGVDSSIITVLAGRGPRPPELYHADVVGDSERPAAQEIADGQGRSLHIARVTDDAFRDLVTEATWYNDMPLTYHVNAVPFLSVCQRAGTDGVKVMLSGEGSDEFFLGYPHLGLAPYLDRIDTAKSAIRGLAGRVAPRLVQQLWRDPAESYATMLRSLVSRNEEGALREAGERTSSHLQGRADERAHLASMALVHAHLASLLHRNDRLGMAAGIENRFPFLGREVTRLAFNLPSRYKLRWSPRMHDRRHPFVVDKWIVRQLAKGLIPAHLAARTKQGFPVRIQDRLRVRGQLFQDGFVQEHWRLPTATMTDIVERASGTWVLRLALIEVWGRLYFHGASIEQARHHLVSHTNRAASSSNETMRPAVIS